jgi:hypothetical protein
MSHGTFSGEPETRWLMETAEENRRMKLLAPFSFVDPDGKEWITPVNYNVDGASIPRAVWTLVGSPYTGDYRRASVVHDKACDDAVGNASLSSNLCLKNSGTKVPSPRPKFPSGARK